MSSRAKQTVRTANSMENTKHINLDDTTILNYLSLFTAIMDPEPTTDLRKYLLPEMFDKEEAKIRMKEIDEIHAKGDYTEAQWIAFNEQNKIYAEKVRKDLEKTKNKINKSKNKINNLEKLKNKINKSKVKVKVINESAGTIEIKDSVKDVADEYGLNYSTLTSLFSYYKKKYNTNKIKCHGFVLEKLS